jgi:hypothetical protein
MAMPVSYYIDCKNKSPCGECGRVAVVEVRNEKKWRRRIYNAMKNHVWFH